ncbi:uncharacterized protein BX664DRAFT_326928 [Halteromyces radiatus]|uniref:uncharacterized protein n=1 Tax=Halteromyces radiatus TaxID=101107 RepID=UPI00221F85E1|nr:uncharacterized protein BX664DRAFT_326928 [Halteromyces radiatus]KAI8097652.1 hypothetical protein BX664DRAFT_326928 [Halteromyces radiatus]
MSAQDLILSKIGDDDGVASSSSFSQLVTNHQSTLHHIQLCYKDFSIHLSKLVLYSFTDILSHQSHVFITTNLNVFSTTTRSSLISTLPSSTPISFSNLQLYPGALRILNTPNAGGSSIWSETLSAELLYRLIGATVLLTEMELVYCRRGSPITDYACQVVSDGKIITLGVSVTRAMAYRRPFNKTDALSLLTKKLKGINVSSSTVVNCSFDRQILHVWCQSGRDAAIVKRTWSKLPSLLRSNTLVLVSTINSSHLFFEPQHDNRSMLKEKKKVMPFKKWF